MNSFNERRRLTFLVNFKIRCKVCLRVPFQVLAGPSSAEDRKGNDGTSRLSVGLIAGISCCLIFIFIVGFLLYRWKYKR